MSEFKRPPKFNQSPDAVFGCPCGLSGSYQTIISHRHGWKLRPACAGTMIDFDPPPSQAKTAKAKPPSNPPDEAEEIPSAMAEEIPVPFDGEDPPPKPHAWEADPMTDALDDEEIARQLNARRGVSADPAGLSWWQTAMASPPSDGNGSSNGHGGGDDEQPGDWHEEPPAFPTAPSQARENVVLPVQVRLMFDWMKGQGWHQGQGTLSDWVTDIVMDHWKFCLGKGIFILNREEVSIG